LVLFDAPKTIASAYSPFLDFEKCIKEIMSDAHNEHESAIKTPAQLITAIVAGLVVPIICIVLLVQYVTSEKLLGAGTESQTPKAIAERIRPVADEGFTLKDANAPKVLQTGVAIYTSTCAACHATGVAGSPKVGDSAAWAPRIGQGYEALLKNALAGLRAMPAKGGNPDLDDVEIARAVVHMANLSGATFKEPEVKAPAAVAATPAADASAASAAPAAAMPAAMPIMASAPAVAMAAAPAADAGKKLYDTTCQICHAAGIAGAPKLGDKAAWADRVKQAKTVIYDHAIKGFQGKVGVMPPKGTAAASDEDVKAAVDYMLAAVK
jgi:cytochrome c5